MARMYELSSENAFGEAGAVATHPGYLGSVRNVKRYLQEEGAKFIAAIQQGTAAKEAAEPIAKSMAKAFLGQDPAAHPPVPGWNEPGHIDVYLAPLLEGEEPDPESVLEHFAIALLQELMQVANYANEPGVTEEQWQWQMVAIYDRFSRMALGIAEPEPEPDDE